MNNLGGHVKSFYPDNYKMDLSETMKAALSKGPSSNASSSSSSLHSSQGIGVGMQSEIQQAGMQQSGVGYVTEKLYMLLQLYLQNKGWNPSVELLQCFSELKDSAMLPSAAYLQVLANRLTLDAQGRLILRENGKIVLPFEHFANAVMLKHMSGPHGLHLSVDATVRAVVESYTIGRENFGMEKDFIIEVVQSCPSPACRYYKNHLGMPPMSFLEQSYPGVSPEFLQHLPPPPVISVPVIPPPQQQQQQPSLHSSQSLGNEVDLSTKQKVGPQMHLPPLPSPSPKQQQQQQQQNNHQVAISLQQQQQQQQQQHLMHQQSRAIAQQNIEKFGNLSAMEKQRVLQQFDKKHFEVQQNVVASNNIALQGLMQNSPNHQQSPSPHLPLPLPLQPPSTPLLLPLDNQKNDILRSNLDSLESNKDLLALHNGAWGSQDNREGIMVGQDKIVRAFSELMRNMARMKTFIRPSMCKPYGKQSESLQKTLMDTLQLVQSLRSFLPAPHIPVSSWKSEDRHRKDPENNSIETFN